MEENTTKQTGDLQKPEYKIPDVLEIYTHSDIYNGSKEDRGAKSVDWCNNHIPHFAEDKEKYPDAYKPVQEALIEVGKNLKIGKNDIKAIFTEIGATVNEEVGAKIRAIIGRWVNNSSYRAVTVFLLAYMKLSVDKPEYVLTVSKELGLLEEDGTENLTIPCAICLTWCLLIETGVAAEKGIHDNKIYMPETLETVISLDKLGRDKEVFMSKNFDGFKNLDTIFRTMFDILINNNARYGGKRPHESEITYLIVVKNALKRIGDDPCDYVYRALDHGQDWSLFAFLTDNI